MSSVRETYAVVEASERGQFMKQVNDRMDSGWGLVGGVSVSIYENSGDVGQKVYAQAMTKQELR